MELLESQLRGGEQAPAPNAPSATCSLCRENEGLLGAAVFFHATIMPLKILIVLAVSQNWGQGVCGRHFGTAAEPGKFPTQGPDTLQTLPWTIS